MTESKIDMAEVQKENRQLQNALDTLLNEFENGGPPDVAKVKEKMPASQSEKKPIEPPWEREGYDSKEEWQSDN